MWPHEPEKSVGGEASRRERSIALYFAGVNRYEEMEASPALQVLKASRRIGTAATSMA